MGYLWIFVATGFHTGALLLSYCSELIDIKGVEKIAWGWLFVALARIPPHDKGPFGNKDHRALSSWGCGRCFHRRSTSYFSTGSAGLPFPSGLAWDNTKASPQPNAKSAKPTRACTEPAEPRSRLRPPQNMTCDTALEINAMAIEVIPINPAPHE